MNKMCNKDVPAETILKHVLRENGMLKNENACLRDEITRKSQAISKFKKWQGNVVEWKIAELLEDSKTILEEPLPSKLVKNLNKIAKYAEEICVFGNTNSTYNPQMKDRVGKGKDCYRYDHYCGNSNHIQFGKVKKKYDPLKVQPSDVLEFNVVPNRNGKLHPTEKPVELLRYLIRTYTNENDVVLDNTMGSGSTIVAAIKEKRQYIGIEKDEKYFEIANERIKNETSQLSFF